MFAPPFPLSGPSFPPISDIQYAPPFLFPPYCFLPDICGNEYRYLTPQIRTDDGAMLIIASTPGSHIAFFLILARTHDSSASSVRMWSINNNDLVLKHVCILQQQHALCSAEGPTTNKTSKNPSTPAYRTHDREVRKCALRLFADYHRSCDAVLF